MIQHDIYIDFGDSKDLHNILSENMQFVENVCVKYNTEFSKYVLELMKKNVKVNIINGNKIYF
jgi:hypothetical protein